MPVATIRYTLPEETMEFRAAQAGVDALITLERIAEHCRGRIKHGELTAECVHELEAVRAMITHELLEILE